MTYPELADTSDFRECFEAFAPSVESRLLVWAIENMVNDQGRPYDHSAFPHLGAPGGPMDAFDDPTVRTISLQFATRLGKTFFAQTALLKTADTEPCPMMSASSVEKLALEVLKRLYKTIEQRPRIGEKMLKSEQLRRQDCVEFRDCEIFAAWSRSTSTLADKNIKTGHAGEFDKWEHESTSKEAHPHKLFEDRFKDYQSTRKVIFEGTPTIKDRSPIEAKRRGGWDCRFHVPCPHCKRFQWLKMGGETTDYGIKWDLPANGKPNGTLAAATARYVCEHCQTGIEDYHRAWMMRRGVWCPKGCEVRHEEAFRYVEELIEAPEKHKWESWNRAKWVSGDPERGGADASHQLSSLYALSLGWGDIAKEYVESLGSPQLMRNFVNQWKGETWEVKGRKKDPDAIAEALNGGYQRGEVVDEVALLTIGIDVQDTYFVWVVCGWSIDDVCYVIEYGLTDTWQELKQGVLAPAFPSKAGDAMSLKLGAIDSGHRTDEIYGYCQEIGDALRPTKGVDTLGKPFLASSLDGARTEQRKIQAQRNRMFLWRFNKGHYQEWLQAELNSDVGNKGLRLPVDAKTDADFMEQLTNNAPVTQPRGNVIWEKIHEAYPDDFRDALILARLSKDMWTNFKSGRLEQELRAREVRRNATARRTPQPAPTPAPKMHNRPGGWIQGAR